mgnify:FL=1
MKSNVKKILSLLLVLSLVLALCACGKSEGAGDKGSDTSASPEATPEFAYVSDFKKLELTGKSAAPAALTDEGFYYYYMEKVGERPVPQGQKPEYEGQFDILEPRIAFSDFEGKVTQLDAYVPTQADIDGDGLRDFQSSTSIYKLLLNGDGNLVVLENVYCSWSEAGEEVKADDPEYYNSISSDNSYYIQVLDKTGAQLSSCKLAVDDPDKLESYYAVLDDKGNLLLPGREGGVLAFSMDGQPAYTIEFNGYVYSMFNLKDGRAGVYCYNMDEPDYNKAMALHVVDSDKGEFLPEQYPLDSFEFISGGGDYDAYYTSSGQIYGYNLGDEKGQPLFSWTGCDINNNFIQLAKTTEDGRILGLTGQWDESGDTMAYEFFTVSQVPYDSLPQKTQLSMAVLYLDVNTQNAVIDFNRSHDNVRIEIKDYSQYNNEKDWSAGLTKLTTEIMAGNMPDIISVSEQIPYRQLAAKGLLEDLYPYMEADGSFNKDDFFPNVLSALEVDGKLYTACAGFTVQTVAGASSVVGDTPGWTYDDYYAALATMPEGCEGFDIGFDQETMLTVSLALDMTDFVDWGSGTCNFDSQDFIDMLEFANQFPSKSYYENYEYSADDSAANRIAQGKQMLTMATFTSTDFILYDFDKMFGGSSTCIGFPTNNGVGNIMTMGESYAMSSSCRDKDAAWQFLRTFLTEEYQLKGSYLPTNTKAFDKQLEKAMETEYQKDGNGNYVLDENGERIPVALGMASDGINTYEIYATSPRQAEQLREVIETSTKMMDYDQSIIDIVLEEAAAYFAGQKSAADVAKLIQSKANIYINEQR